MNQQVKKQHVLRNNRQYKLSYGSEVYTYNDGVFYDHNGQGMNFEGISVHSFVEVRDDERRAS